MQAARSAPPGTQLPKNVLDDYDDTAARLEPAKKTHGMTTAMVSQVAGAWRDEYDQILDERVRMKMRKQARETLKLGRPQLFLVRKGDRLTLQSGVTRVQVRPSDFAMSSRGRLPLLTPFDFNTYPNLPTDDMRNRDARDVRQQQLNLFPDKMDLQIADSSVFVSKDFDPSNTPVGYRQQPGETTEAVLDRFRLRHRIDWVGRLRYPSRYVLNEDEELLVFRLPIDSVQTLRLEPNVQRTSFSDKGQTPFLQIEGLSTELRDVSSDMFFMSPVNLYPGTSKFGYTVGDAFATPWSVMMDQTGPPMNDPYAPPKPSELRSGGPGGLFDRNRAAPAYERATLAYTQRTGLLASQSLEVLMELEWRDRLVFRNYGTGFAVVARPQLVSTDILVEVVLPMSVKKARTEAVKTYYKSPPFTDNHDALEDHQILAYLREQNNFRSVPFWKTQNWSPEELYKHSSHPDLAAANVVLNFGGAIVDAVMVTRMPKSSDVEVTQ